MLLIITQLLRISIKNSYETAYFCRDDLKDYLDYDINLDKLIHILPPSFCSTQDHSREISYSNNPEDRNDPKED